MVVILFPIKFKDYCWNSVYFYPRNITMKHVFFIQNKYFDMMAEVGIVELEPDVRCLAKTRKSRSVTTDSSERVVIK
jgi:hypothetical protein